MTKAEIIDAICDKVGGFSKREAGAIVETVFETMKEVLAAGYKIKISGFGNFVVRDKGERKGLNPRTGERITLPPRRVVRFKPSPRLKARVNRAPSPRRSSAPPARRSSNPPPPSIPPMGALPVILNGNPGKD